MSAVCGEGEDVLLYLDERRNYLVRVRSGQDFHTDRGFIRLADLVGVEYGSRVKTSLGNEFTVLKPSIRDYVMKAGRATQIMYPKDIGVALVYLGVGPGSRVVEAGTGSGALTSALAYYVKPSGRIFSYELRPEFTERARRNLERAGLLEYVELKSGDVTVKIDERDADAVVFDLATPWLGVRNAYETLRGGGGFASFSPTVEQVVKTVEALRDWGFVCVETVECMLRRIKVKAGETRPETLMVGHTGYLSFARKALR